MKMDLEKANRAITIAWILTLVVGGGNIILTIAYGLGGTITDVALFNWIDLLITFALAFGIYKKSRNAAGIWLLYYLVTQTIGWLNSDVAGPPVLPILFLFFFFQGFRGTIAYHQLKKGESDLTAA